MYGYLSQPHWKGYRKHIIFDLLKDKADLFYSKMLERKLIEEKIKKVGGGDEASNKSTDFLSQDSENYNDDYKLAVQNQLDQDITQREDSQEDMSFQDDDSHGHQN